MLGPHARGLVIIGLADTILHNLNLHAAMIPRHLPPADSDSTAPDTAYSLPGRVSGSCSGNTRSLKNQAFDKSRPSVVQIACKHRIRY